MLIIKASAGVAGCSVPVQAYGFSHFPKRLFVQLQLLLSFKTKKTDPQYIIAFQMIQLL